MGESIDRIYLNFQKAIAHPPLPCPAIAKTGCGIGKDAGFFQREGSSLDRRKQRVRENRHFFEWSRLNSEHYVEIGTEMGFI